MKRALQIAALATVYYLAARLGFQAALEYKLVSLVWPPSGIALAAVLALGYGVLPGVFLGAVVANYQMVASLPNALCIGVGNTLEALAAAWLLGRVISFRKEMDRVVDVIGLVVLGGWIASTVAATVGTGAVLIWTHVPIGEASRVWLKWWFGDAIGIIILTPAILILGTRPRSPWTWPRALEALALATSVVAASLLVFRSPEGLPYVAFPFLMWAALRFERKGAAATMLVVSAIAIFETLKGLGPFIHERTESSLLYVQSFMGVLSVTGLVLAAALCERRKVAEERRRLGDSELAQLQLKFLSRASKVLGESLEHERTIQNVVEILVPGLADYAVAAFYDNDGKIATMSAAHRDPAKLEFVRKLKDHMPDPNRGHPIGQAYLTGKPVVLPRVDPAALDRLANNAEHRALTAQLKPASYMAVPLAQREGGRPLGLLIFIRDRDSGLFYSERDLALAQDLAHRCATAIEHSRLYQAAQSAIRARSEFLSVAAHELKTPVTVISGLAYLVARQLAGEPKDELRADSLTLQDQAMRLSARIERLLDATRIDADKLALERKTEELAPLVRETVSSAQRRTRRHELTLDCPAQLRARVDAMRFEQVLINLLDNAIKYSPDGGRIEVTLKMTLGNTLELAVRDHGMGIDEADLPRVFERFYRVRATGRVPSGMGLGLFITREIVRHHGGEIQASGAEGGGTRFVVTIPGAVIC